MTARTKPRARWHSVLPMAMTARDTARMLVRLLSLITVFALACASTQTHANARLPQPETAHRAFATIEETASRAEALLIASCIKANGHPEEVCASAQRLYGNNSPYKFTDPDGRYSCAGTAAECAQVDQYVATIDKAKFSPKLNGREQRELRKTTNYLGKAGGAGPVLTVESLPNDTKAHTNQAGKISIDVAKNTSGGDPILNGAMALTHEAAHDIFAAKNGPANSRETAEPSERYAYGVQNLVANANGVALSSTEIERAVEGSLNNAFGPKEEEEENAVQGE